MKSFEKSLIASLHGDASQADQLFRDFVAEHFSTLQESDARAMTTTEFTQTVEGTIPEDQFEKFESLCRLVQNKPLLQSIAKMNDFLRACHSTFCVQKVTTGTMGGFVWYVIENEPVQEQISEGQLDITQGEDGVLHLVHHPEGSGSVVTTPEAPEEIELDPAFEALDADEDELDELQESLADDLEKMILGNDDGQTVGDGEKIEQEKHSPVPNVAPEDRPDGAKAAETVQDEHNGFDVEPAPKVDGSMERVNTHDTAKDALEKPKAGKALLTQMGDDSKAKSPISGNKLRESREQQRALLAFCDEVDKIVEQQYGLTDGGDLCFTLVENGTINMKNGVARAAQIVAQYLSQR